MRNEVVRVRPDRKTRGLFSTEYWIMVSGVKRIWREEKRFKVPPRDLKKTTNYHVRCVGRGVGSAG